MTVIEQLPELKDPINDDDLPIAHLPDDESMAALQRGERPSRGLCGAELLGIDASGTPFRVCETCEEIAFERGMIPA